MDEKKEEKNGSNEFEADVRGFGFRFGGKAKGKWLATYAPMLLRILLIVCLGLIGIGAILAWKL